jgi:hypothetical protein
VLLLAGGLLGILFDPEDGSSMFRPDVGKLLPDYAASRPRV